MFEKVAFKYIYNSLFLCQICPYPSDDNLQDSLQLSVDWNEHRRCELSDTVKRVRQQRIIRETTFPTKLLEGVK